MAHELVKYATEHGDVSLSPQIIRQYLVPTGTNVSDQEVMLFLRLCEYQKLNPFLREVYLVKYGSFPASMVTGKEVFTKRAAKNPDFNGMTAGITIVNGDKFERREGSLLLSGEKLVGGWCKVHLKSMAVPYFEEVSLVEYIGKKSDGTPTGMWLTKPSTMIRKVAIVHALREAFPETFEGLYSQEEINTIDATTLPTNNIVIPSANEVVKPNDDADGVQPYDYTEQEEVPLDESDLGNYRLTGGKYAGLTLLEVAQQEISYLTWSVSDKAKISPDVKSIIAKFLAQDKAKTSGKVVADITPKPIKATKSTPIVDDGLIPPPVDWANTELPFDI